jgi:hypothetical protein
MARLGKDTMTDRATLFAQRMQAYSMQSVTACERAKANEAWTPDEIEILLDPDMTRREKIDALQRTYYSMVQATVRYRQLYAAA